MSSDTDRIASLEEKVHAEAEALERMAQSHCQELATKQAEIDTLEEKLRELTGQLNAMEANISERDESIDHLECDLRNAETEVSYLQEQLRRLEDLNDSLQAEVVNQNGVIEELQSAQGAARNVESEEQWQFMQSMKESQMAAQHANALEELRQRLATADHEISTLQAERMRLQEELETRADMYADELQDVRKSLHTAQNQISVQNAEIRRLTDATAALQTAMDHTKEEKTQNMVATSNELMFLSGKITKLEAENTALQRQMAQTAESPAHPRSAPSSPSHRDRALTRQGTLEQEKQDFLDKISSLETQIFHLQESETHKDTTIKRMRQIFADQMAVGGLSPPDSPSHGAPAESADDLERAVEVMEKKVRNTAPCLCSVFSALVIYACMSFSR